MKYNAVIIGGGLSGLAAGAALIRKKKKVLILEQHFTVGGLAAGFTRKGYYFDAGMSRVNKASVMMPLKKLNLLSDADFAPHRCSYSIEGHAFCSDSAEEYFRRLGEIFAEEKDKLMRLYDEQLRRRVELLSAVLGDKPANLAGNAGMLLKVPAIIRDAASKEDFNEVLKRYLDPEGRAYLFLCERWEEVNYRGKMNAFMKTGKIVSQMHNDYPVNGFQGLCDTLADSIRAFGGEISTRSRVQRILMDKNRCMGVEVLRNNAVEAIPADAVVSAIDLNKAFFGLIGESRIPGPWAGKLRASELAATMPILYLGLNIPADRLRADFGGKEELMYYPIVRKYDGDHLEDEDYYRSPNMVIHSSSLINPRHAPDGKSSVQVYLQHAPRGWLGDWGVIDGMKTERYAEIKRMVIGQALDSLEKAIPELADRSVIEMCELGTPHTIERFTGSTHGCGCGFTMDGDTINPRTRGKFFDRLPGIDNLYFCGQQACWPGAAGSALSSGVHVADLIK